MTVAIAGAFVDQDVIPEFKRSQRIDVDKVCAEIRSSAGGIEVERIVV